MTYVLQQSWPHYNPRPETILSLNPEPYLGVDLEWNIRTGKPSILGVSDGRTNVSVPFYDGLQYLREAVSRFRRNPSFRVVGHNFLGSDLFVLRENGFDIPVECVEDSIVRWYLTNAHLSKGTKADTEEERRGRGFMNLWTMCSCTTSLRCWKWCRGEYCEGPCPKHQPYWYNATDSLAPVIAMPTLKLWSQLRAVDHLYPLHRDLMVILAEMTNYGVQTDVPYTNQLRVEFEAAKEEIRRQLPFNPNSPPQVKAYFKKKGIELEDAKEETIREAVDDYPNDSELSLLLDYKEAGNGADRWFAPRVWNEKEQDWEGYVDENGLVHPSIGIFTSNGRLNSFSPNFQNVAKRRIDRKTGESIGKRIRQAVIPREGYDLYRADYTQAENHTYLHLAGYHDLPREDFHTWMSANIGLTAQDEFSLAMGGPREGSKTIVHAQDYLEGLKLVFPNALKRSKIEREIGYGARLAFPYWQFHGKVVTFTGINLAKRVFRRSDYETRKKVLEATERYFGRFPKMRDLQQKITRQVELTNEVRTSHGYRLFSYGYDEDRLKQAASVWGSNPVAHFTKLALLKSRPNWDRLRPILQVHDELLFEVSKGADPKKVKGWIRDTMEFETKEIPGLILPTDVSHGPNWREQKEIEE